MDKKDTLLAGFTEGKIEALGNFPLVNILVAGLKVYQDSIEEQQRFEFLNELANRIQLSEAKFSSVWYSTPNGQVIAKKIIAIALNAEYVDKISYFANSFINASMNPDVNETLKFIEILKHVSKPALQVLATEKTLQEKRGSLYSTQVVQEQLILETQFPPHLVESCISELCSLGVFSSTLEFFPDGTPKSYTNGTPAYTNFTKKFVEFISAPKFL